MKLIRPTSASLSPELLKGHTEEEQKLYDLIWRQFISCQMPDAKYLSINAFIDVEDFRLFAKEERLYSMDIQKSRR